MNSRLCEFLFALVLVCLVCVLALGFFQQVAGLVSAF
jgi:hypothetical protein